MSKYRKAIAAGVAAVATGVSIALDVPYEDAVVLVLSVLGTFGVYLARNEIPAQKEG